MRRLYSSDAATDVRPPKAASDAGTWTPDDEDPSDVHILDGREWDSVRLFPTFRDATPEQTAGTSVVVDVLLQVPEPANPAGYRWLEVVSSQTINDGEAFEVEIDGHNAAVRVTTVTLGGATDVVMRATGGNLARVRNG